MNNSIYLLKQAWAGLSSKKGFLLTVVTTLGLTLGALLCILTFAHVLLAKPLPYPKQESLYQLNAFLVDQRGEPSSSSVYNYPSLLHLSENQSLFSQSALVYYGVGIVSTQPTQPTMRTTFVTPQWFSLFGATLAQGRTFEETEAEDSFNPVAILSYETWQNEFQGDNNILGQTITIGSTGYRVVGVLSKSFIEPQLGDIGVKTDIFLPWDFNPSNPGSREVWGGFGRSYRFIGRLDSQLSESQINQSLTSLVNDHWRENIGSAAFIGWSIKMEVQSLKSAILGDTRNTVLLLLAGVVGLVLIACANIINLFMSRTAEQQRQLAIQAAVGASKNQLFQALFAQSGLLVFISVIVALIIADRGFWILQEYLSLRLPRVEELETNGVTLGSSVLISLLLALFFARLSANMINYRALNTTLQSSGKGTGIQVSKKARNLLVISQVAIVTILVFINMGLLKDALKIIYTPLGFETENISTVSMRINSAGELSGEKRKSLMLELKSKLTELPQVEDVTQSRSPLKWRTVIQRVEGTEEEFATEFKFVDDRYFQIIGQPLVEGDFFSKSDVIDERNLFIVNDVYAEHLKEVTNRDSAVGIKIIIGESQYTVVGVVKGIKMPREIDIPMRAYELISTERRNFILKLNPNQTVSRELLVQTLQEVSSQFNLLELEGLDKQKNQLLFTQYTTVITCAVLAAITFFLASIGLYGILSYSTQIRRFELGTRIALGAKRIDILRLIIKDNAGSVGIGVTLSIVSLLGLFIVFSDALSSHINSELITLFLVTLGLIFITALFACYWPLRPIINFPAIKSLHGSQ